MKRTTAHVPKASRHDRLLFAMDDGDLPRPEPESQLQRMRRVLSLCGGRVQPAARLTFTERAAAEASVKARSGITATDLTR